MKLLTPLLLILFTLPSFAQLDDDFRQKQLNDLNKAEGIKSFFGIKRPIKLENGVRYHGWLHNKKLGIATSKYTYTDQLSDSYKKQLAQSLSSKWGGELGVMLDQWGFRDVALMVTEESKTTVYSSKYRKWYSLDKYLTLSFKQTSQDLLSEINKDDEALATRNEALLKEEEISKGYRKRELLPEQKELTAQQIKDAELLEWAKGYYPDITSVSLPQGDLTPEQIKDEKFRQYRPNYVDINIHGEKSRFWYGFDRSEGLFNKISLFFESVFPDLANAFGYDTPDEIYGEGFTDLSVERKYEILIKYKEDQLRKKYPVLTKIPPQKEHIATVAGDLIGSFLSFIICIIGFLFIVFRSTK